jgi:hypothetical protein
MQTQAPQEHQHIDQATREKILGADLANIVKKVKSGKPLSHRERKLITEAGPAIPPDVFSIAAIARMTCHDRATIRRAVAGQQPAAVVRGVKLFTLASVEAWLGTKPDKSLRDGKLFEEIRKLRLKNDATENKVVLRTEIAAKLRTCLGQMVSILEQRFVNELPTAVSGLEPPQVRIVSRRIFDEALAEIRGLDYLLE